MEKQNKKILSSHKVDASNKVQEFITKLERCLLQYKKHLHRRTVLRLGKYIKGNSFHLKILQLGKVRQYKHMVSFYLNKQKAANQSISHNSEESNKIDNLLTENIETSIAGRLETLRKRRKTLEDKEKQQRWDVERKLEDHEKLEPCTSRAALSKDEQSKQEVSLANQVLPPTTTSTTLSRTRSFFDKLLSKINRSNSTSAEDISKETNKDDETSSCSSSMGFLGFHENEAVTFTSAKPNSLSDNLENKSAFISEELEEFLKENALENCSNITVPTIKFQYEEGMVHSGSEMPTMEVPKQLVKRRARTVAEKRQILESKKDVKFLMVENESTIYWELQRRLKKTKNVNYDIITMIQNQDIPIRRGVWKTAAWLATRSGKFYFQSIEIQNDIKNYRINLYGGHGNFESKLIRLRKPDFKRYNSRYSCNLGCSNLKTYPNLKIDLDSLNELTRQETKQINRLNLFTSQRYFKPGPLSSKLKQSGPDELQIFEMPKIQLEVHPRLGYEFTKDIKKYLKLILPSDQITEEWAKFAVSALVVPTSSTKKTARPKSKSISKQTTFEFDVPYSHNQNKVLTIKDRDINRFYTSAINISSAEKEMKTLGKPLKHLQKCVDRNDTVQCEIGDYLNDIFDSTVIGLCQNSIAKNDPDLNYNRKDGVQSQLKGKRISNFHDKKVLKNKSKLLNELKRLNATFIETSDASENHECNEEHCTLGCVCTDIRKIPPQHCRKEKCMFECTCKKLEERAYIQRSAIVEDGLSEEDMKLLRDRATCRLAKMEKDFSSTIVLTNDNTILIHNTQVESKRNRKPSKILKGYSTDDVDKVEEKASVPAPALDKETVVINANKYKSIEYMTHCNVVVDKVPELDNLEVWCMVHCLYKCFCNGTAVKGDVFGFADISAKNSQHFPPAPAKRRNYTFEKTDTTVQPPIPSPKQSTAGTVKASVSNLTPRTSSISSGPRSSKINKTPVQSVVSAEPPESPLSRLKIVNYEYYRAKNKASRRKIFKYGNAERKFHSLLKQRVNDCLYSKRLNQFKKTNNVVIVLSESEDEKEDDVEAVVPAAEENGEQEMDIEQNESTEPNESSAQNQNDASVEEQSGYILSEQPIEEDTAPCAEDTERCATPEPVDLPKYSSPDSYNPFNHRIPVDKFIQFSQQIENGTIKSPSTLNSPVKSENVTKLNLIVTKAMSKLCEMQKNNLNDIPDPKPKGFNNISWDNLIKIYRENKIFIWEVRRMIKSGGINLLLAVTKTSCMPKIENAVSVVFIKAVRPDELSVTGKMINLEIMNEKTKNLAVIIYGQQDHWLILGCIHSEINYLEDGVCVRPTPATHPLLATKINRLNTLLCINPVLQNRNTKTTPIVPLKFSVPPVTNLETLSNAPLQKSNIEVVPFSVNEEASLFLPIPVIGDHRWFMLTIENDFSDIYIPTWHSFLKYERIVATHNIARARSKTVRILHMNNEHTVPHVFITPKEANKIFFGPYRVDQDVSMVLCQECNGKMLSREVYEEQTKVDRGKRTTGCWLYVKNNEIVRGKQNQEIENVSINDNSDDVIFLDELDTVNDKNECILIEDDDDDQIDPPSLTSSPPVLATDGKKVILAPRSPPIPNSLTTSPDSVSDNNKLDKSAHELEEKTSELNGILPIHDAVPVATAASAKDTASFSLVPGSKRNKIFSILKPVVTKASGDSVEIVFNRVQSGQTAALTNLTSSVGMKQVSLLKNHANGTFYKLRPITQLSVPTNKQSLSPPAKQNEVKFVKIKPMAQLVSPNEKSISPPVPPKPDENSEVAPKKFFKIKPLGELSTQTSLSPPPTNKSPTPPITEPSTPPITETSTPPMKEPTTSQSLKPVEQLEIKDKGIDTLITINEDKIVTKPAPPTQSARLVNRRKTMDASTILNRMVFNPGSNLLNNVLGKRKSNEHFQPMKKPLLNTNLKVYKKQGSDGTGTTGVPPEEQIKIVLKRKKSLQNEDQKFTKLRIVEDPNAKTEKSSDAVTKAIIKLSSTATYIRSTTTSTVTSTTLSTSPATNTSHTLTFDVQTQPIVTSTASNVNLSTLNNDNLRESLYNKTPATRILNGVEAIKLKETTSTPVPSEETDSRLNIKAYIIPQYFNVGKIPCVINKVNITFQLPTMNAPVTLSGLSSLNQFIHRKIRESVHSIIPSDLNLKFAITTDRKKMRDMPDLRIDMLNKHKVLTEYGFIDLRSSLDTDANLKNNHVLMVKLLILQLDRLLNEKVKGATPRSTAFQILQKTQIYVKQLKAEEAQLMKTKLSLYKEIYHRKNEVSKLSEKHETTTSNVNSPTTTSTVPPRLAGTPSSTVPSTLPPQSKRLFLQYGRVENTTSSKNEAKTAVSGGNSSTPPAKIDVVQIPTETIVIDDDDD